MHPCLSFLLFLSSKEERVKINVVSVYYIANFKKKKLGYLLINIMCGHVEIMYRKLLC
jgi:hypothetical protein